MAERSIVRELVTLLGFDADDKALKAYESRIVKVKKNLTRFTIAAGLLGGAIAAIARQTAVAGNVLAKTSEKIGIQSGELQEWRFIAERSLVTAQAFDSSMRDFGRRTAETARGIGSAQEAFFRLGIEVRNDEGGVRDLNAVFEETLLALNDYPDTLERNRLAAQLFDVSLVNMAKNGADGLAELRKRFRELNATMDEQTQKLGAEAVDAWTDLGVAVNGLVFSMGKQLLPIVIKLLNTVTNWIAKNQKLISTIGWITFGIVGLTAAVFAGLVVWHTWAAAIALVNAGLILIVAKAAAVIALVAAIALLGEDVGLFLRGGADTVTGRAISGLKTAGAVAIDFWKREILNFVTNTLPAKIRKAIDEWAALIRSYWNGFVNLIQTSLKTALDLVIPPELRQLIADIVSFGEPTSLPGIGFHGEPVAALAGLTAPQSGVGLQGGPAEVSVTIHQTPGETGTGVAARVSEALLGEGVTTPLNGLSR